MISCNHSDNNTPRVNMVKSWGLVGFLTFLLYPKKWHKNGEDLACFAFFYPHELGTVRGGSSHVVSG